MPEPDEGAIPETLAALPGAGGDATAVLEFSGSERREWSFDELRRRADRLAGGLRGGDDRPVLLFAPPSGEAVAAALGVLRAGRILVPLDTRMPDDDLRGVLDNCEARLALTTHYLAQRLEALEGGPELECFALDQGERVPSWEEVGAGESGEPANPDVDDVAMLFYTSGTTGPPKGVPLTHRNIRFQFETAVRSRLLRASDRFLQPLPMHHVYPFVNGLLTPLAFGLPVILPGGLTGSALARALRDGGATVAIGVPRLYQAFFQGVRGRVESIPAGGPLLDAALALGRTANRLGLPLGRWLFTPLRNRIAPRLRILVSGGSPLDPELARDLEALGWPVVIGYGMTETAPLLTLRMPGASGVDTVGRAVEGVELRTDPEALADRDDTGSESSRGELQARGPNVFRGYHGRADTGDSFTEDDWFRTGDIARIAEDGTVRLGGRVSTRIALQGGENIDPEKLEDHYQQARGVDEIGILEHDGRLAALVVPEDPSELSDHEAAARRIRRSLEERGRELPSYQRPATIEVTRRPLQRTRLGKLRRHALAEAFATARDSEDRDDDRGPREIDELSSEDRAWLEDERVRALWDLLCERYPDRPVAPDARLEADLGIDSLEWVELSLAIERATGAAVDEELIGRVERVRNLMEEMAAAEEAEESAGREPVEHPERVLEQDDQHWAEPRGPFGRAVAAVVFHLLKLVLQTLFRVETRGSRPPRGACILAPNHASFLDAPALAVALGRKRAHECFWAGRSELMFRTWLRRRACGLFQIVPIDPRRGPLSSLALASLVLERDRPLVWFPEGERSQDGALQEFRPGIGLLLEHRDVPVVPVFIAGTHDSLPPGARWPKPGVLRVHFGEPLSARELRGGTGEREPEEIAAALREAVERLVDEHREEAG